MIHQYCMYVYQRGIIYIRIYMFIFTIVFMYFRVCACSNKQFYKNSCYCLYVLKRGTVCTFVNIVMCIHVIDWTSKEFLLASPGPHRQVVSVRFYLTTTDRSRFGLFLAVALLLSLSATHHTKCTRLLTLSLLHGRGEVIAVHRM